MNIIATAIACVAIVGACIVIAVPIVFIAYECKRFFAFVRRAYSRRRLNHIIDQLKPIDVMIKEASR